MVTDPKMDFRYSMGDVTLEAYQITPATRWQQELWPPWLKMQRLGDETNALYTAGDGTESLILCLPSGDEVLPPLAWIALNASGGLNIIDAMDMENYTKVVPIPPPEVHPPADGVLDAPVVVALKAVPTLENLAGDTNELRNEMMSALKMLQEANTDNDEWDADDCQEALDYLKKCLSARTLWCTCPPGRCEYGDSESAVDNEAGCRQHSPLVS